MDVVDTPSSAAVDRICSPVNVVQGPEYTNIGALPDCSATASNSSNAFDANGDVIRRCARQFRGARVNGGGGGRQQLCVVAGTQIGI